MVNFVFSPSWFYGIDVMFEGVTLLVSLAIALYAYRIYKFSEVKRYYWYGISFLMLAGAFAAKIFTNITSYYNILERNSFGLADIAYQAAQGSDLFFMYGYAAYRLLTLLAFLGIYLVMSNKVKTSRSAVFLFTYFAFAMMYFSKKVAFAFHLTTALFLFFIFMFTFRNCYRKTTLKAACVTTAFFILMISQLLFIPGFYVGGTAYVAAEVVQLVGYVSMLFAFVMVRRATK